MVAGVVTVVCPVRGQDGSPDAEKEVAPKVDIVLDFIGRYHLQYGNSNDILYTFLAFGDEMEVKNIDTNRQQMVKLAYCCLLYTSPSPRD